MAQESVELHTVRPTHVTFILYCLGLYDLVTARYKGSLTIVNICLLVQRVQFLMLIYL